MSGKWTCNSLAELAEINPQAQGLPSEFVYIDLECVEDGALSKEVLMKKAEAPSRAQRLVSDGDILYQLVRPYQKNNLHFRNYSVLTYVASTGYAQIRAKVDPVFLYYQLHSDDFVNAVLCRCTGTGYPAITPNNLSKINIFHPVSIDEQRHIASILSACDTVLTQTKAAIEKYESIKHGMLNDLLTRGLASDGTLRPHHAQAPDLYQPSPLGLIPKEWQVKRIGELFDFRNGLNKAKEFFGYGTPIVNYMDVYSKDALTADNLLGRVYLTSDEIKRYEVLKGDVFFTRTSETPNEIGYSAVMIQDVTNTVFSGFVLRARPITGDLLDQYKRYCFQTNHIRRAICSDCTYTTRALTNGTKLSKIAIPIPPQDEQKAIAARLSATDDKITAEQKALKKYQSLKEGLMRRLLTPPEGVEVS